MHRTVILIPAFNASATLPKLLHVLLAHPAEPGVLVVDDGSTDGTAEIAARAGVEVLVLSRNGGKGNALSRGFEALRNRPGLDAVVTMDADLQHDPYDLDLFLQERKNRGANLVLGFRKRWGSPMPLERKLSNTITSWMVSSRIGEKVPDSQCGYRLIGVEVLKTLNIESDGYEAETEVLIKAARHSFTFASIMIRTRYDGEQSHMTYWQTTKRFVQTVMREF